jgi:hypothetical protein
VDEGTGARTDVPRAVALAQGAARHRPLGVPVLSL